MSSGSFLLVGMIHRGTLAVSTRIIATSLLFIAAPGTAQGIDALPDRAADLRVATIAYELATAGKASCPLTVPRTGLLLEHLAQFERDDRPGLISQLQMDRGPVVTAVVPDSAAAKAGLVPGDILLTVADHPLPAPPSVEAPFDQDTAQRYTDALDGAIISGGAPVKITVLRNGNAHDLKLIPVQGCPSRIHLARSSQRNAFADGKHVVLTTKLVELARDDNELAFIIAHEMAHNILNHAVRMRAAGASDGLFRSFGKSGAIIRETEREADLLGSDLAQDAGYDPASGARVLKLVDTDPIHIAFLSLHDSVSARIKAIRKHLARRSSTH